MHVTANQKYTNLGLLFSDQNPFTFKLAVYQSNEKNNFLDRKESKLTVTNVDLQENCIYAIAKNQLYDADDEYIIHGASDYLKGQVQLSQIKEGETIIVISNGKVLQSDPYQFDTIYSIRPQ